MKKWWEKICFKAPLTQRCQSWVTFCFLSHILTTSQQSGASHFPEDRNIVKLWDSWSCSGGGSSTRWTNHYDCRLLWFFLIIPDIWQQLTTDLHLSFFTIRMVFVHIQHLVLLRNLYCRNLIESKPVLSEQSSVMSYSVICLFLMFYPGPYVVTEWHNCFNTFWQKATFSRPLDGLLLSAT